MTGTLNLLFNAPTLLALAALGVVLGTAANWLSIGFMEQVRNSVLMVVLIQGVILLVQSAGWTRHATDGDVITWSFGVYVVTLLVWWVVDALELVATRFRDVRGPAA